VRRSGDRGLGLTVNTRIARWFPLEVFHLFGYRKRRQVGDTLVVTRRVFDSEKPKKIQL
jgi:hypothetical protein